MQGHTVLTSCLFGCVALAANVSSAGFFTTGAVLATTPPSSVAYHQLESNDHGFIFQEQSQHVLSRDTRVSIPGRVGVYDEQSDMSPFDLAAGTVVDSYFLHFDSALGGNTFTGSVQFDRPILGVMLLPFALQESDLELGADTTLYPAGWQPRRGLDFEDFTPLDSVTIVDSFTLAFDVTSGNAVDQIRVLTGIASVPEPSSAWLLSVATPLAFCRRHRR